MLWSHFDNDWNSETTQYDLNEARDWDDVSECPISKLYPRVLSLFPWFLFLGLSKDWGTKILRRGRILDLIYVSHSFFALKILNVSSSHVMGTSKYTSTFQNTLRSLDRSHCNDTVLSIWQRAYIWKEMCKHKLLLYWYHTTVKYSSASWI